MPSVGRDHGALGPSDLGENVTDEKLNGAALGRSGPRSKHAQILKLRGIRSILPSGQRDPRGALESKWGLKPGALRDTGERRNTGLNTDVVSGPEGSRGRTSKFPAHWRSHLKLLPHVEICQVPGHPAVPDREHSGPCLPSGGVYVDVPFPL